tara:strand:- start:1396 stop:1764 length:369 start_codon:yes stop_codon:yes gene_type:complete
MSQINKTKTSAGISSYSEKKMTDKNTVGHQIERFITSQDPTNNTVKIFVSSEIDTFNGNYITEIKSCHVKSESSTYFLSNVKDREILQCILNGSSSILYVYHNGSEVILTKSYRVDHHNKCT